ncbi:MAG: phosphofructokinase [Chloroflexi bacterium]|jgi:6-phosphofructokinase 1|nr:phosphofructokinase [Chloroflexota bacterium]
MTKKRVGVMTGGGDVPGLNLAIKSVVLNAVEQDYDVIGIRLGWGGLLRYNLDNPESTKELVQALDVNAVRKVDRTGGTFLHTSRTNPSNVRPKDAPEFLQGSAYGTVVKPDGTKDYTDYILKVLDYLGIDSLITIGGDDTLSYSARLYKEGFPVVAIPKTMDNDVYGTDYCIGFSTSITQSVSLITNFRSSVGSHERIGIVELFGRNSGETSLVTGYLSFADRTIICEVPFNFHKLADFLVEDRKNNPSNYAMCVISEGAVSDGGVIVESGEEDAYGHKKLGGIGELVGDQIKALTGQHIMFQKLAYLVRSGPADMLDRMVALNYGTLAMQLTAKEDFGKMVAINNGVYTTVPIDSSTQGKRHVDVDMYYDKENYRPHIQDIYNLPMFLV